MHHSDSMRLVFKAALPPKDLGGSFRRQLLRRVSINFAHVLSIQGNISDGLVAGKQTLEIYPSA